MSLAQGLVRTNADLWDAITTHPFVVSAADGSLSAEAFDRWIVADHHFVVGFRRYLGRMLELAPDEPTRDLLAGGVTALHPELQLFRDAAVARGLDLSAEPGPTTLGYTSFVQAAPADGFVVALAVLYGAERAYLDAWTAVRAQAQTSSPYWRFIDNWSSAAFHTYVTQVGAALDRVSDAPPAPAVATAFRRVVRFELSFWDAVHRGETWE